MQLFKKSNESRITEIARSSSLPDWLAESLIVEYLPCRHYLNDACAVMFDFGLASLEQFAALPKPYLVFNNFTLIHNISREAFKTRILTALAGFMPVSPASKLPSEIFVEGKASPSYFAWSLNDIAQGDWKLSIGQYAIVVDDDGVYQWEIARFTPIPNSPRGWFVSDVISAEDLTELQELHETIYGSLSTDGFNALARADMTETNRFREMFLSCYDRLEVVHKRIRTTLLEYHEQAKRRPEALLGYTEHLPPITTVFDQVHVQDGKLMSRLHLDRILFRAAYRAKERALTIKNTTRLSRPLLMTEEMEAVAECIVMSVMCLEAYINGFVQDHLPHLADQLEQAQLGSKWLIVPELLGKRDCFDKGKQPYQGFSELIKWRNDYLAHYKHKFHELERRQKRGDSEPVSKMYGVLNAQNAIKATECVRAMIKRLDEYLGIGLVQWVENVNWITPLDFDSLNPDSEDTADQSEQPPYQPNTAIHLTASVTVTPVEEPGTNTEGINVSLKTQFE